MGGSPETLRSWEAEGTLRMKRRPGGQRWRRPGQPSRVVPQRAGTKRADPARLCSGLQP
ncbi:hypothetical protein [Thermogemmatispora sp.]|uniref:hypothetical protein n=1 Tax=Thermogemmatispora sp. TaxID=1968838 RepID=UPI0035E42666